MGVIFKPCVSENDSAQAALFLLERKLDLHPSFTTLHMVELLYSYLTQGHMLQAVLPDGQLVGAAAYYVGTPEGSFEDRHIALLDVVIFDRSVRGTRVFLDSLVYLVDRIKAEHPQVEEIQLAALSSNAYLRKMYSKLMPCVGTREGTRGEELVFSDKIDRLGDVLRRYCRV